MGVRPSIQKANLDGSDPEVLIARNLVLPSDLAVDIANQRLYWLDSKLGALESCTTAGKNRKMLKQFYGWNNVYLFCEYAFETFSERC